MLVFGTVGFNQAKGYERRHGVAPWRLPPVVWGLIAAVSLLVGAVLMYVATKADRQRGTSPTD
jgi:hypothetical protein